MSEYKISFSGIHPDQSQNDREYEAAIQAARTTLGREQASIINGKEIKTGKFNEKYNPANLNELVAKYHTIDANSAELDEAFNTAKAAQKKWGATPWQERAKITEKAAAIMFDRRMKTSAIMTLEVGKTRAEALGDAEESGDLLNYYANTLEKNNGYTHPLAQMNSKEKTQDTLRPYGVFAVIAPFNYPMALGAGMTSGVLLGGNSAILKPSDDAPGCAYEIYSAFKEAGLPEGVLQVVYGKGPDLGIAMTKHKLCDGVAFTGSKAVGMSILQTLASGRYNKPLVAELGGKNAAFVTPSANLDTAAQGCMKSTLGLSGQKCSALSRLYVHEKVYDAFMAKLLEQFKSVKVGDPSKKENYVGPLITENAVKRHLKAIEDAKALGKIAFGGTDLRGDAPFQNGNWADPTIAELPKEARHFQDEFFSPFLAVTKYSDLADAIEHANTADYGLTSGLYTQDKTEIDQFMNSIEAGVLYVNRPSGATTGAWPGVQSFCGWKGSGITGKGGCGPFYVSQFMREQSRTVME